MKKLLPVVLMLMAVLFAFAAYAEEDPFVGNMMVVNVNESATMRSQPDKKGSAVTAVKKGEIVRNCVYYTSDFIYAEYGNYAGYIGAEYLIPSDGVKTFEKMKVVNCKEYVTLRSEPKTSASEITKVYLKETVENCVVIDKNFTRVSYNGYVGYILSKYLEEVPVGDSFVSVSLGKQQVVNCNSWVSLRRAPDKKAVRTVQVPLGKTVTNAIRVSEEFAYAEYNGKSGFILYEYLSKPANVHVNVKIGDMRVANCTTWVSLREKPDVNSARLAKVPLGTLIGDCTIFSDEFIFAKYNGKSGYIAIDYTEIVLDGMTGRMMQVANCNEWVSFRMQPSSKAKKIENVVLGAVVESYFETSNSYSYVEYDGKFGFIATEYLTEYIPYTGSLEAQAQLMYAKSLMAMNNAPAGVYLVAAGIDTQYPLSETGEYMDIILNRAEDEWYPLVYEAAKERLWEVEGGTELYLVIPADENSYIGINFLNIYESDSYGRPARYDLASSENGAPFLLRCNASEIAVDSEIVIIASDGAALIWSPQLSGENGHIVTQANEVTVYDFTKYEWTY